MMKSEDYDGVTFTLDETYTNRFYPEWAIEVWKEAPLCPPSWEDAEVIRGFGYYDPERDLSGDVGGINFRPLRLYPEDLKVKLDDLRKVFPREKFRMVMRVQAQKVVDESVKLARREEDVRAIDEDGGTEAA